MWTTIPGATDDPQPPQMHPTHDNSWSVEKSKQLKPRICEFKLDLFAFIGLALCQWQCSWPRWIAATILSLAPPDNITGTMWSHLPWFLEFWHYTICYSISMVCHRHWGHLEGTHHSLPWGHHQSPKSCAVTDVVMSIDMKTQMQRQE